MISWWCLLYFPSTIDKFYVFFLMTTDKKVDILPLIVQWFVSYARLMNCANSSCSQLMNFANFLNETMKNFMILFVMIDWRISRFFCQLNVNFTENESLKCFVLMTIVLQHVILLNFFCFGGATRQSNYLEGKNTSANFFLISWHYHTGWL